MDIRLTVDDVQVQIAFDTINTARVLRGQEPYPTIDAYLTQEVIDIVASYGAQKATQRQADPKAVKITEAFGKASDAEYQAYLDAAAAALKIDLSAAAEAAEAIKK